MKKCQKTRIVLDVSYFSDETIDTENIDKSALENIIRNTSLSGTEVIVEFVSVETKQITKTEFEKIVENDDSDIGYFLGVEIVDDNGSEISEKEVKEKVKKWMKFNYEDYKSATELAEAAANHFKVYSWLDDCDHWIWDLALDQYADSD